MKTILYIMTALLIAAFIAPLVAHVAQLWTRTISWNAVPPMAGSVIAQNAAIAELFASSNAPIDDGRVIHDRVVAANESLFAESHFSQPLTEYAVGFRDPNNIEETVDFYAPPVQVPRKFEYAIHTNAEEFYSETEDRRAIGADFATVEYTESKDIEKTENRGLAICVDLDEVADKANWREFYTGKLKRRLLRNKLRRGVALLSAAATNTGKTWDTTAGKDPDQDVRSDLITAATSSGIAPNRVGYGDTSWNKRNLSHRAQDNAGGYASSGMTPEQVAGLLNVDQVHVSRERYSTGGSKAEIVNNLVLMFYAENGMSPEDASNIKGFWSPCEDGGMFRVYEWQVGPKVYKIAVEHYEKILITSTLGIRKFTVS